MSTTEPVVLDVPALRQFEIRMDGEVAGMTAYVDDGGQRIFYHTEVGEEFSGRGLAGVLVHHALDASRDAGWRIVPVCPYVRRWLSTHSEQAGLDDVVDPVTPAALAAVERTAGPGPWNERAESGPGHAGRR